MFFFSPFVSVTTSNVLARFKALNRDETHALSAIGLSLIDYLTLNPPEN